MFLEVTWWWGAWEIPDAHEKLKHTLIVSHYGCWHCDFVCDHGSASITVTAPSFLFIFLFLWCAYVVNLHIVLSFTFYFCSCSSVCVLQCAFRSIKCIKSVFRLLWWVAVCKKKVCSLCSLQRKSRKSWRWDSENPCCKTVCYLGGGEESIGSKDDLIYRDLGNPISYSYHWKPPGLEMRLK